MGTQRLGSTRSYPGTAGNAAALLYRIGFISIGVVYFIIGLMSLFFALGIGGKLIDAEGALTTVGQQPFGKFLLLVLGIGMLGYVLWRFAQAFANIEHKPSNIKNTFLRAGFAISGFIYLSLSIAALRAFAAKPVSGKSEAAMSAKVLAMDIGPLLLSVVGLVLIGVGIFQIYKGLSERFLRDFETEGTTVAERKAVRISGKIGLPARGVTFAIIGYFLIKAGLQADPAEARGTKGVMEAVLAQPFGNILLGIIAAGFIAYAVYCVLSAKNRHFPRA